MRKKTSIDCLIGDGFNAALAARAIFMAKRLVELEFSCHFCLSTECIIATFMSTLKHAQQFEVGTFASNDWEIDLMQFSND